MVSGSTSNNNIHNLNFNQENLVDNVDVGEQLGSYDH